MVNNGLSCIGIGAQLSGSFLPHAYFFILIFQIFSLIVYFLVSIGFLYVSSNSQNVCFCLVPAIAVFCISAPVALHTNKVWWFYCRTTSTVLPLLNSRRSSWLSYLPTRTVTLTFRVSFLRWLQISCRLVLSRKLVTVADFFLQKQKFMSALTKLRG